MADGNEPKCELRAMAEAKLAAGAQPCPAAAAAGILEACPVRLISVNHDLVEKLLSNSSEQMATLGKHTVLLENINENAKLQSEAMRSVAENTKAIAETLADQTTRQDRLVDTISGKKQVPLSVFIVVVLLFGLMNLLFLAGVANMQVSVTNDGFTIYRDRDAATQPTPKP